MCPFAEGWCNCIEGAGSPAAPALLVPSHFIVLSICTTDSGSMNDDQTDKEEPSLWRLAHSEPASGAKGRITRYVCSASIVYVWLSAVWHLHCFHDDQDDDDNENNHEKELYLWSCDWTPDRVQQWQLGERCCRNFDNTAGHEGTRTQRELLNGSQLSLNRFPSFTKRHNHFGDGWTKLGGCRRKKKKWNMQKTTTACSSTVEREMGVVGK